jgi:hypothetical protein
MIKIGTTEYSDIKIGPNEVSKIFRGEDLVWERSSPLSISGGTKTTLGGHDYHTFTSNGTLTVTGSGLIEFLILAGGGGGGSISSTPGQGGGGGGAGGFQSRQYWPITENTYSIVVGTGGAGGGYKTSAYNGSDSTFHGLTATGGGRGGGVDDYGGDGGSGGGARSTTNKNGSGILGTGYNGGIAIFTPGNSPAGGGGGAGSAGGSVPNNTTAGVGGSGKRWSNGITYGGGGGGGVTNNSHTRGSGGSGGGGRGGNTSISGGSGVVNSGGGGGGCGGNSVSGGNGGSGIVIIRYPVINSGVVLDSLILYLDSEEWNETSSWTNQSDDQTANFPNTLPVKNVNYMEFDSLSDVGYCNAISDDNKSHTLDFWYRPGTEGVPIFRGCDGFGDGWSMNIDPFQFSVVIYDGGYVAKQVTGTPGTLGEYIHVTGVFSRTGFIKLYVNGILLNTLSIPENKRLRSSTRKFSLGTIDGTNYFNGGMCINMAYDKALSDGEVEQNHNALCSRFGLSPV